MASASVIATEEITSAIGSDSFLQQTQFPHVYNVSCIGIRYTCHRNYPAYGICVLELVYVYIYIYIYIYMCVCVLLFALMLCIYSWC